MIDNSRIVLEDDECYQVIDKIKDNDKSFVYLINTRDKDDLVVRKEIIDSDETRYLVGLDNEDELEKEFATENDINNEELEGEEEEEEEIDPSKEIALLFDSLVEMYSKKQYKKILKTIVVKADKEEKFNLMEWKLLFMRTQTLQKIMERK